MRLTSRVSNRSAVGAKIEMRAGSLRQQLETYAAIPQPAEADLLFALGDRAGADVVRVLWPSGILQAEIGAETAGKTAAGPVALLPPGAMTIEELDRKPSSCPFLYTWNGERFTFITDFLGGGEMGYWLGPGERNTPDPDEYVRIDGEHLKPRNGRYELRITNELEESLFLDRAQLVVVSHPQGIEIHPNEGLVPKPGPFALFPAERPQSPLAASDDKGHDLLAALAHVDRRYADGFALERIRGYAADHTLNLTLPAPGAVGPPAAPADGMDRLCVLGRQRGRASSRADAASRRSSNTRMRPADGTRPSKISACRSAVRKQSSSICNRRCPRPHATCGSRRR